MASHGSTPLTTRLSVSAALCGRYSTLVVIEQLLDQVLNTGRDTLHGLKPDSFLGYGVACYVPRDGVEVYRSRPTAVSRPTAMKDVDRGVVIAIQR